MLLARYKKVSALFLLLVIIYVVQSIIVPPAKATLSKYHISATHLRLLALTVVIPYIIIWLIALLGYLRLHSYAKLIKHAKDGIAFSVIAKGIALLSLWLPLSTIISGLFSHYYSSHPASTANLVRLDNYINLIILLVAFILVNRGSRMLVQTVKRQAPPVNQLVIMVFIAFSALYVLLILHDPVRQFPSRSVAAASYYQPDWLLIITIIIPRLIMWFFGVQAVLNIYLYREKVKGSLYKSALANLARGIGAVVLMTILLRCVQSLSEPLARLSLGVLLGVVYVLLVVISIGYILIVNGAHKLQKLEEL